MKASARSTRWRRRSTSRRSSGAEDLTAQCDDLERSLKELRALIRDLTRTIDERFAATFDAVARNFAEVIETLFPGGRGRLRLTESEPPPAPVEGEEARRRAAA